MTSLLSFYNVVSRGRELERAPCLALVRDFLLRDYSLASLAAFKAAFIVSFE